uniref:Putative histidine-containing phosphotransfer(Hpt) protein n=1 Tax=Magnetococcus massalia (strain MO-1) TaxID=451514 RepID=A0A1S7LKA9_MAGMO|nr:putative histidine-containing phosphotransfer(Hpt) protein [Candidatus Magnetococcus massalia]
MNKQQQGGDGDGPQGSVEKLIATLGLLDGYDVVEGLRLCGGKRERFIKVLNLFYRQNHGVIAELQAAWQGEQWDKAHRMAHSLKGSSASIGALQLSSSAAVMDTLLKSAQRGEAARFAPLLEQLARVLEPLLGHLQSFQSATQEPAVAVAGKLELTAQMRAALAPVVERVAGFDSEASDQLEELVAQFPQLRQWSQLGRLRHALEGYAFDEAEQLLHELLADSTSGE